MKKVLSIFTLLIMMFCFSINLLTYAVNEPVKDSKQTSTDKSGSTIAKALNVTGILVCGAVTSVAVRFYSYKKGYQDGRDDNWLSWKNVSNFAYSSYNVLLPVLSTIFAYKILKGIGNSLATAINTSLNSIGARMHNGIASGMDIVGAHINGGLQSVALQISRGLSFVSNSVENSFQPLQLQTLSTLTPPTTQPPVMQPISPPVQEILN